MTKKDYMLLASALAEVRRRRANEPYELFALDDLEDLLCEKLANDNPSFQKYRFRQAANRR